MGSLWAFATAFYTRPGVEPALLSLQDQEGLDVPVLIALLHAGRQGAVFAEGPLRAMLDTAKTWHSRAIGPLRMARRALKAPAGATYDPEQEALRRQVKAAELAAEHLLLDRLERLLPPPSGLAPPAAIDANLDAYLKTLPQRLDASALAHLKQEALSTA
jgi:uncharacterized protein (TIGR02444 family)